MAVRLQITKFKLRQKQMVTSDILQFPRNKPLGVVLISDNKIVSDVEEVFCCGRTVHLHLLSTTTQWVAFLEHTTTNTAATKDEGMCSVVGTIHW